MAETGRLATWMVVPYQYSLQKSVGVTIMRPAGIFTIRLKGTL